MQSLNQLEAAEASFRKASELNPAVADVHSNLGDVLLALRRFTDAAASYRRAIDLDPRWVGAHYGLATSLRLAGDIEAAIESYDRALALNSDGALLWNDLGSALRAVGRLDDATEAFRRALAIEPDLAIAYYNLAVSQQLSAEDPAVVRMAARATQTDLPIEERVRAGFAVGEALDKAERYDEAFAVFDRANHLYRAECAAAGERFDAVGLTRGIDRSIAEFNPAFFAKVAGWGNSSELPVFIVGAPRSGTSLVEQIAASHSRVFGAGELSNIGEAAAELGAIDLSRRQAAVRRTADAHLERLRKLGGGAERVIDKMPDNIFRLDVIATLYPAARIIFCRRDPRDIGLSCFFQFFATRQMFSYDLIDCGRRMRETERMAAHWRRVLPLRWMEVQYELLVADLEGESRRLIEFLGLEWEPACLDFHRTERTVLTASTWQVRQPLYNRSVGRWRQYERHLGPLLKELARN